MTILQRRLMPRAPAEGPAARPSCRSESGFDNFDVELWLGGVLAAVCNVIVVFPAQASASLTINAALKQPPFVLNQIYPAHSPDSPMTV